MKQRRLSPPSGYPPPEVAHTADGESNWVALETHGFIDLEERLAWLARVLEARDFPLPRLGRNLELAAEVIRDDLPAAHPIAERLAYGAQYIRSKPSFLE